MNILGYRRSLYLLPKPLARNVKACSLPRALGLFSFTKSLFLRRAAAHASPPFLCMG